MEEGDRVHKPIKPVTALLVVVAVLVVVVAVLVVVVAVLAHRGAGVGAGLASPVRLGFLGALRSSSRVCDARVTSTTARSKAAELTWDGWRKPLTLRMNCSAAACTSSGVAGASARRRVLMLRHMS